MMQKRRRIEADVSHSWPHVQCPSPSQSSCDERESQDGSINTGLLTGNTAEPLYNHYEPRCLCPFLHTVRE